MPLQLTLNSFAELALPYKFFGFVTAPTASIGPILLIESILHLLFGHFPLNSVDSSDEQVIYVNFFFFYYFEDFIENVLLLDQFNKYFDEFLLLEVIGIQMDALGLS